MVPSLLCTFVAHITFLHVFFLPPPFILSLSLLLSLSLSFSLSLSLSLPPLSLCGCKTHVIWCPLRNILFLINLTFFHAKSCHSSYKLHQPFTDYFLRLPYSEMLEKRVFRSRANRRLVVVVSSMCSWLRPTHRKSHAVMLAGHVLGQQHRNSFAQSTHARAWLAHGACKFLSSSAGKWFMKA